MESCKGWTSTQKETKGIWMEIRDKVKKAIIKQKKRITPWKIGKREWYNKEWKEKKRKLRKTLRNLKKERINREVTLQRKRNTKSGVKSRRRSTS